MHIVLVETASVRGFDMVAEMADSGIEVSFVTESLDAYRGKPGFDLVARAARVVEVPRLAASDDLADRLRGRLGDAWVDGVICRDEVHLHAAAGLARDLGLPHEALTAARLLGDKAAVRERLDRHGIGSLRWRVVTCLDEGRAALDAIGLPLVVKPTAGGWSVGVTVAWSRDTAERALAEVLSVPAGPDGAPPRALIEEYAVGRHVSAELLVQGDRTVLLGFAERLPAPPGTTAELGGHFPARFDGAAEARLFALRTVAALGIRSSAVHMELLITPTGPELIEVNGRVAGHVVAQQMSVALGRSLADDLVALAVGSRVEDAAPPLTTIALHQLWSPVDGTVGAAPPAEMTAPLTEVTAPGVIESRVAVGPGDRVGALRTNHDRFGYVLARGADAEKAARTAAQAARRVVEGLRIAADPPHEPAGPADHGQHLLLLLGPGDPADRVLAGIGAVTARLSVVWTGSEEDGADARELWRQRYHGCWRTAATPEEIRRAARRIHAADPVRAAVSCSTPIASRLRSAPDAYPVGSAVPGDGHTVLVVAGRTGAQALAVIDDGISSRSCPSALPLPARQTLRERAEQAVREAGLQGVVRCVFSGHGAEEPGDPALLPGMDAALIDLYDAVHRRGLVAAVALTALGLPVPTGLRAGVAVQRRVLTPAGPFRVIEATTGDQLRDWPGLFRAEVSVGAGHTHTGRAPREWLRHTVVGDNHARAQATSCRLERSLVLRTAPAHRTHLLLLDRVGTSTWTRPDGSPLFPADRFRVSVLSPSGATGPTGPADLAVRTDLADDLSVRALVRAIHDAHPVHRVATLSERLLEPAAAIREALGLPGDRPEETQRFVDKAVMKRIAHRNGLRYAEGLLVHSPSEVVGMYERHGKIVLKPRASSGSQGVAILADGAAVQAWLRDEFVPGAFLCEEFIDAPMCHIDAVVHDGEAIWDVSLYERDTMALRRGLPLSSATVADPVVRAAAGALLDQVVEAWHVRSGVLHLEAFVTGSRLTFCEVAGRPGGAGVSEAFRATRGIDLDHAKLLADAGQDPRARRRDPVAAHAGWTVHYAPGGRKLLRFDDSSVAPHAYFRSVGVRVGDSVPLPLFSGTGVSTHVFAQDTHREVGRLLLLAEREVRIETGPAAHAGAAR